MVKITVTVEGMRCGMCEAHICDALRAAFPLKKVSASRKRGEALLLCDSPIPEEALRSCVESCGYSVGTVRTEEIVKEGRRFAFSFPFSRSARKQREEAKEKEKG